MHPMILSSSETECAIAVSVKKMAFTCCLMILFRIFHRGLIQHSDAFSGRSLYDIRQVTNFIFSNCLLAGHKRLWMITNHTLCPTQFYQVLCRWFYWLELKRHQLQPKNRRRLLPLVYTTPLVKRLKMEDHAVSVGWNSSHQKKSAWELRLHNEYCLLPCPSTSPQSLPNCNPEQHGSRRAGKIHTTFSTEYLRSWLSAH